MCSENGRRVLNLRLLEGPTTAQVCSALSDKGSAINLTGEQVGVPINLRFAVLGVVGAAEQEEGSDE